MHRGTVITLISSFSLAYGKYSIDTLAGQLVDKFFVQAVKASLLHLPDLSTRKPGHLAIPPCMTLRYLLPLYAHSHCTVSDFAAPLAGYQPQFRRAIPGPHTQAQDAISKGAERTNAILRHSVSWIMAAGRSMPWVMAAGLETVPDDNARRRIQEQVEESKERDLYNTVVNYTAEDAKNRAPEWARSPGQSLEELRKKWRKQDAPAGLEYSLHGTDRMPKTKNLSALLYLELVEAVDVDKAVSNVISVLSDELLVILVHMIHELRQTYIIGPPSSGKALRVDANLELVGKYEAVLESWNARRRSPPSTETMRVVNFVRDVASGIARPQTKMYKNDCVVEAIMSGALKLPDLPTLRSLTAVTLADIEAPPCTEYQSLRIALKDIEQRAAN